MKRVRRVPAARLLPGEGVPQPARLARRREGSRASRRAPLARRSTLRLAALLIAWHAGMAPARSHPDEVPAAVPKPSLERLPEGVIALVNGQSITRSELHARLLRKYAGSPEIDGALSQLVDHRLILQDMKRRKFDVSDADVEQKLASLREQVRSQSQGQTTLDAEMARTGVDLADFRSQLRYLVALERMARADFAIPVGEDVSSARLNVWLADARGKATVKREDLPKGVVLVVNGEPIYEEEAAGELEKAVGKGESRAILNELIGMRLVQARVKELGIAIEAADIDREMAVRRRQFEKNPRFAGVDFGQFLQATRSQTPEQMKADEEFAAQVALKKIVLKLYPDEELRRDFEENKDQYGPLLRASHILIKAAEPGAAGGRTFDEARALIEKIQSELEGGADFAALAAKHSEDSSRLEGGDVGLFPPKGLLDEAFSAAASRLAVGQISPPVRTAAGWHLIKLTERRPDPTYADVRDEIVAHFARRLYRELVQSAEIKTDP